MAVITKRIKIPIYYGNLLIHVAETQKEACEKFGFDYDGERFGAFCFRRFSKKNIAEYSICVFKNDIATLSIIAHEVVHLKNYIFEDHQCFLDVKNDEPEAYLTGWLFEEIYNYLTLIKMIDYGRNYHQKKN